LRFLGHDGGNQLQLSLASTAYVLVNAPRRDPQFADAAVTTIREPN
jgi:hypothetical protein